MKKKMSEKKNYSIDIFELLKNNNWIILFGCAIFLMPFLLTRESILPSLGNSNDVANIINGLTNPFITFLGALLTFLAFHIQYQANQKIQEQLNLQSFESKFLNILQNFRSLQSNIQKSEIDFHKATQIFENIYRIVWEVDNLQDVKQTKKDTLFMANSIFLEGYTSDILYGFSKENKKNNIINNRNKLIHDAFFYFKEGKYVIGSKNKKYFKDIGIDLLLDIGIVYGENNETKLEISKGYRKKFERYFKTFNVITDELDSFISEDKINSLYSIFDSHLIEKEIDLYLLYTKGSRNISNNKIDNLMKRFNKYFFECKDSSKIEY